LATVFFLGDFGLGTVEHLQSICAQLKGNKVFIRGNHDSSTSRLNRIGFPVVLESAFLKIGRHNVELIHIPSDTPPAHFQLHGHVHEKRPNKLISNQLNLCVEVWDYKPVSEKTIISLFDKAAPPAS
jgi:calcineurin-like phosphoesterase family protein